MVQALTGPLIDFSPKGMPYNPMVPKDLKGNLRWRKKVLALGRSSEEAALDLWRMCSRDPLFWVNTFVWTYDPRLVDKVIPFITYPFQDEAILDLIASTGIISGIKARDLLIEKSRDMGATWCAIIADVFGWQFREMCSYLWVSRKEELVDKPEDPKCMFWKALFILKHYPSFMRPRYRKTHLHLLNHDTGGTIDGESTTGEVARGDRRTSITLDEFASVVNGEEALASTADATDCRKFNSTPKGTGNAFYTMVLSNIRKLRFHWSQHPVKSKGVYTDDEGKLRSPWYDRECDRRASKLEVAQELDIDYLASGSQFFDTGVLTWAEKETVRPAYRRGDIILHPETGEVAKFDDTLKPRLWLWVNLDEKGRPPDGNRRYVLGVDASAGSDASNSCITIADALTGEKVGEFVTINVKPHGLADYAVALAKWFVGDTGSALIIWEGFGPGQMFGDAVIDLGYRRVFYRPTSEGSLRARRSDKPGWFPTRDNKTTLLGHYRRALASKKFINRSWMAIAEAREFVYMPNGGVEHARSMTMADPSGAKKNHGDRVMADALAWLGMKGLTATEPDPEKTKEDCYAARRRRYRNELNQKDEW